jgi:hypothetical protein
VGVLDDAIREHLDLKRRRGADAAEVERQAAEALGPARREPALEPAPAEVADEVAPAPAPEDAVAVDDAVAPDDAVATNDAPAAEVTQLHPIADDPAIEEALPEAPPPDDPPEPDEVPADEQIGSATEGDRLWFEQRPSRDFDLDE